MADDKSKTADDLTMGGMAIPSAEEMLTCSVMVDYFNRIADLCDLTDPERLALLDPNGKSPVLAQTTIRRISDLLNLWDRLTALLPEQSQAFAWMKQPNDHPMFGGEAPLKRLSQPGGVEEAIRLLNRQIDAR